MRKETGVLLVVLTGATLPSVWAQGANGQTSGVITCEEFMALDRDGRIERFNEIGPENKALIVRTQAERWLAKNRERLSPAQVAVMQESINFVSARLYDIPMPADLAAKVKALGAKAEALLDPGDIAQALHIQGQYIPR